MPSDTNLEPQLAFGDFVIDRADERVIGPEGPLKLGNKAYRVLLALAGQEGKLLTKDALFSTVWDGTIVSESALTSTIKELRRALGDESRTPRYIESVYGRGYRLLTPVHTVEATQVVRPASPAAAPTAKAARTAAEVTPPIVLVSAFEDEAVRDRFPWCAAELREEVLSGLSRFPEIQLIADNRPEEEAAESRRHARGYQLTATLLPDGDGVRVAARAKRLADGRVLWGETMSLAATGTAGGVERIVRRIAGAALPAVDEDLLRAMPQESDDLYDRYLVAKRRSFAAETFEQAKAAAEALEAIIAERPGFALAYPPLVRLYNTDFGYTGLGSSGEAERSRALQLAKQGLAADRTYVHALTVLAFCHLWQDERALARQYFEQALALNPYYPVRLQECATGFMYLGELERSQALLDKAYELNPIPDDDCHEDRGRLLLIAGDYAAARAELEAILSGSVWAPLFLSMCEVALDVERGKVRFADWRKRVERQWHTREAPDATTLVEWIMRHHPLPTELANRFRSNVQAALGTEKVRNRPAAPPRRGGG
jgi:DNA-binding winged helix-turn-helix (wHTH) protein/tetratricopeptide (TPR) repeat protein